MKLMNEDSKRLLQVTFGLTDEGREIHSLNSQVIARYGVLVGQKFVNAYCKDGKIEDALSFLKELKANENRVSTVVEEMRSILQ